MRPCAMSWCLLLVASAVAAAQPRVYHVAPGGDDAQPGDAARPWRTLQKAAATAGAGDSVLIHGGRYTGQVEPARDGAEGAPVVFRAVAGDSAVLDGAGTPLEYGGLFQIIGRAHITVCGLQVRNAARAGYFVEDAQDIRLEGCATYNTVSSGIGAWTSRRLVVADCDVALACNDGDQECITVAGCDSFEVRDCRVHDGGPGNNGGEGIDAKDGSRNGLLVGNVVRGLVRLGIYVDAWDKHTHDIEVAGNSVSGCADGFAVASENGGLLENVRLVNNVAYGNRWRGYLIAAHGVPGVRHPMRGVALINNTAAGNGFPDWGGGIAHDNPEAAGVVIRNNLCSGNNAFQILVVPAARDSAAVDHNLLDPFRGDPEEVRGRFAVEGDPRFVDSAAANFRLRTGSPAIDAGSGDGAPAADFDSAARPAGAGVDIGAFEFAVADGAEPASYHARCAIEAIHPVPARDHLTVTLRVAGGAEHATLRLYDAMGRLVAVRPLGALSPGVHGIAVPLRALPPGVYVCALGAGGAVSVRLLPVLR